MRCPKCRSDDYATGRILTEDGWDDAHIYHCNTCHCDFDGDEILWDPEYERRMDYLDRVKEIAAAIEEIM